MLTIARKGIIDPYVVRYEHFDTMTGGSFEILADASIMDSDTLEKPGLGRYAVINPRRCNTKFVKSGERTWGFAVRDELIIKAGDEIFRRF